MEAVKSLQRLRFNMVSPTSTVASKTSKNPILKQCIIRSQTQRSQGQEIGKQQFLQKGHEGHSTKLCSKSRACNGTMDDTLAPAVVAS
jgi:hypothetical protein